MFKLRRETIYAIQFLRILSRHGYRPFSINDVALSTGISFLFLQKIARKLRLSMMIKSVYGKNGGYLLVTPAKKITLRKIIEVMEGARGLADCSVHGGKNVQVGCYECRLKQKTVKLTKRFYRLLEKVKLADL